ncbi:hypothetical protein Enr13x_42960 [Stieleria neptunia]|uniref:Uncharacterized protein n=1 Tax=Stieleria neptunia TaxID=2527979 RepID=A0A518HU98_9BACT|nr:hypothetical protein Enr13x_42960 [Stieleria neptunia]
MTNPYQAPSSEKDDEPKCHTSFDLKRELVLAAAITLIVASTVLLRTTDWYGPGWIERGSVILLVIWAYKFLKREKSKAGKSKGTGVGPRKSAADD